MPRRIRATLALALLGLAMPAAHAPAQSQPRPGGQSGAQPEPRLTDRVPSEPGWSSDRIAEVGEMLEGSWRSAEPLTVLDDPATEADESRQQVHVVMHLAHVLGAETNDLLYVELAREDSLNQPYHQSLMRVMDFGDRIRLRMLDVASQGDGLEAYAGLWAAPDKFPRFEPARLIGTLDIALSRTDRGFQGKSPHPYPTNVGGAVETASQIEIAPDQITTHDRGLSPGGDTVWGERVRFEPYDPPISVRRYEGGLVVLDYPVNNEDAPAPEEGDQVSWAMERWLHAGARSIGSTEFTGMPVTVTHPISERLTRAMQIAASNPKAGSVYRIYAPPEFAYGEGGDERRLIPSNAAIMMHARVVDITPAEEADSGAANRPARGPRGSTRAPSGAGGDE